MKTRESGMPDETIWDKFFDAPTILDHLGLDQAVRNVVEFGCGYGTFTIPAARRVAGMVYAFDIEPAMVELVRTKAQQAGLANVICAVRDFIAQGTGLADGTVDFVMLFNILHAEQPELLLHETWRVLRPGGQLGIIHWNYDPTTPRGPSMTIRPRPDQCRAWAEEVGFRLLPPGLIHLPPYHYGFSLERP